MADARTKIALIDDDRNILTSVSMALEAEGFVHVADVFGMAANLRTLDEGLAKPEGLTVSQVGDLSALSTWSRVISSVNEFPDFAAAA